MQLVSLSTLSVCCFTAELREDAESALEEARVAVEAEEWEAGREACREALRLMVQAGMTKELSELEELEKRVRDGEAKSRDRKEGDELVQKAKAALGSGDFEGAREALLEARGAFRRAGWEEGEKELQAIFGLVEAGEKRATRRREGEQSLAQGQVCRQQNKNLRMIIVTTARLCRAYPALTALLFCNAFDRASWLIRMC